MIIGPHVLHGAYFGPLACVVLERVLEDRDVLRRILESGCSLESYLAAQARGLRDAGDSDSREAGQQLLEGLAQTRSTRSKWQRVRSGGSVDGTSEHDAAPVDAGCESPLPMEDSSERTARQVASECRVSESYVTRLCREGTTLRGRLVGGVWLIEAASVAEFKAKRRSVA